MIPGFAPQVAGMLLFDKPKDWTSHDAVEVVRRMLPKGAKAGHTGTLDPLATGLLVILVGPCTRLQQRLQGLDKMYSGLIRLGLTTDTGDVTGKTLEQKSVPPLDLPRLQDALDAHLGALAMAAPAYSAVKHHGKPLYKYARQGLEVPVKSRTTTVREWKALSYVAPDLEHRLSCGSGTYVRSLAESVGRRLGCGATVLSLRRERIGPFDIAEAITFSELKALNGAGLAARLSASLPALQRTMSAFT